MSCPHCRDVSTTPCSFCGRTPHGVLPLPAGPRLAPLMDALPAEDDRLTARPTLREPPAMRPKLHLEEIESPAERARSKRSMAFEIGIGLLCVLGGAAWIVSGLGLGVRAMTAMALHYLGTHPATAPAKP